MLPKGVRLTYSVVTLQAVVSAVASDHCKVASPDGFGGRSAFEYLVSNGPNTTEAVCRRNTPSLDRSLESHSRSRRRGSVGTLVCD
jgi:hypothetical protein